GMQGGVPPDQTLPPWDQIDPSTWSEPTRAFFQTLSSDLLATAELLSVNQVGFDNTGKPLYSFKMFCSGTAISSNQILTATHCIDDFLKSNSPSKAIAYMAVLFSNSPRYPVNQTAPKTWSNLPLPVGQVINVKYDSSVGGDGLA